MAVDPEVSHSASLVRARAGPPCFTFATWGPYPGRCGAAEEKAACEMFKNTFQSGFLSILYSIGSKPLQIWDKKVRGWGRRGGLQGGG